jgi:hypothetical protein
MLMTKKAFDQVSGNLDKLTDNELRFIARTIAMLLEAREKKAAEETTQKEVEELARSSQLGLSTQTGGGYYEKKMINGCGPYLYYRWRNGKKLMTKYCGKV